MKTEEYKTDKTILRDVFLEKRKTLTAHEQSNRNAQLLYYFVQFLSSQSFQTVHSFLSIKKMNEVNTWTILGLLEKFNTQVVISKSDPTQNRLTHYVYEGHSQLKATKWGIPEPTSGKTVAVDKLDMVLVPLIVFDRQGHRIGYGKGYYDVFLSQCRPNCIKVGLSLTPPLDCIPHIQPYDIPLDCCITHNGIHKFNV